MANDPLWGGRFRKAPAKAMLNLTSSLDFDLRLLPYDVAATRAHAAALARAGILEEDELGEIVGALDAAVLLFEAGSFPFGGEEDVHSAVERFLTDRLGDTGARIHAGRSRNDLVVTDLRLWLKDAMTAIISQVLALAGALLDQAKRHQDTVGPGYTHLQRAQPVLLAHLLLAHVFALLRDIDRFRGACSRTDVSCLGAAALAGTTLPIDPASIAEELGFGAVFDNAADAVASRDFAVEFLAAAAILGSNLSRLAEDIVLWTTAEFGFASLDDAWSTGSSIMPQKKNPDVAELARAKAARLTGNLTALLGVLKGLPLAYNRDLQEDKEAVFDSSDTLMSVLPAMAGLVSSMQFDAGRLSRAAAEGFIGATDLADYLVLAGVPFRIAHRAVGGLASSNPAGGALNLEDLQRAHEKFGQDALGLLDPRMSVQSRKSHGGTAPESVAGQLAAATALLQAAHAWVAEER